MKMPRFKNEFEIKIKMELSPMKTDYQTVKVTLQDGVAVLDPRQSSGEPDVAPIDAGFRGGHR